jgi:hypothetical protein
MLHSTFLAIPCTLCTSIHYICTLFQLFKCGITLYKEIVLPFKLYNHCTVCLTHIHYTCIYMTNIAPCTSLMYCNILTPGLTPMKVSCIVHSMFRSTLQDWAKYLCMILKQHEVHPSLRFTRGPPKYLVGLA